MNTSNLPVAWGGRLLFPDPTFLIVTGFLFVVFGVIFAIWARIYLGQHWSGAIQLKEGQHIVQSGPYRYVRHPIYTGIVSSFIGLFLMHPQRLGLITLLLVIVSYHRKMNLEEAFLVHHFGQEYEQYKQKTSRIIPFIY